MGLKMLSVKGHLHSGEPPVRLGADDEPGEGRTDRQVELHQRLRGARDGAQDPDEGDHPERLVELLGILALKDNKS